MNEIIMLRFPALNKPDMDVPTPGTLKICSTRNLKKWLTLFSCRCLFGSANMIFLNKLSPSPETHEVSKIGARGYNFPTQVVISYSFRTAKGIILTSSEYIIFPNSSFDVLKACSGHLLIFVKTTIVGIPKLQHKFKWWCVMCVGGYQLFTRTNL